MLVGSVGWCAVFESRCRRRRRNRSFGMLLQVGINIFGDDKFAPHELVMRRITAKVFVVSFFGWRSKFQSFGLAGLEQFGRAEDVGRECGGQISAALLVELVGTHGRGSR